MPITIAGFHHAGFLVTDITRATAFYEGVLGLKTLPRPEFSFDGRWYDLGNNHQLHLMCIERVPGQTDQPTFDRHIALEVPDLEKTAQQLEKMQVDFARSRSGFPQLFVRDPDGNMIELRPAQ